MASEAEKELERIERELDAKATGGKAPVKAADKSSPAAEFTTDTADSEF